MPFITEGRQYEKLDELPTQSTQKEKEQRVTYPFILLMAFQNVKHFTMTHHWYLLEEKVQLDICLSQYF